MSGGEDDELAQVYTDTGIKFFIPRTVGITKRGEIALSDARMQIGDSTEVDPGLYGFRVYVCAEPGVGNYAETSTKEDDWTCTGLGESYGQYTFIVEIK